MDGFHLQYWSHSDLNYAVAICRLYLLNPASQI